MPQFYHPDYSQVRAGNGIEHLALPKLYLTKPKKDHLDNQKSFNMLQMHREYYVLGETSPTKVVVIDTATNQIIFAVDKDRVELL